MHCCVHSLSRLYYMLWCVNRCSISKLGVEKVVTEDFLFFYVCESSRVFERTKKYFLFNSNITYYLLKAGYCQMYTNNITLKWFFQERSICNNNKKNRNACILENMQHILEQYFNCQIQLHENLFSMFR